jgi:eukaryotic-like serine/threonine-protein kinase
MASPVRDHRCSTLVTVEPVAIDTLSPTSSAGMEVTSGTLVGRFRIEERIGAGAMGAVYTARDEQLGRRVAVKLVKNPTGGAGAARFLREAQVMAKLAHPNVAVIYEGGSVDGRLFIAMELVDGETVASWLERPRTWREVLALFLQAGRGLAEAHAAGIVHRDFKPANVLVGQGRARVVDFGLAADIGDLPEGRELAASGLDAATLTQTGMVLGTPAYMAPEQRVGARATAASDQYSFCIALWEALSGARPNDKDKLPVRPIPRSIKRVLERGLAEDPDERWPSMVALLDALEPALASHRLALMGGAIVALAAIAMVFAIARRENAVRPTCGVARERLAGIWDADRRAAMRAAFLGTKLPYAERQWFAAEESVDHYTADWVARSDATCRAAESDELPKSVADTRQACLDRHLDHLRAWVDLFGKADARLVRDAARAGAGLEDLAVCDDPSVAAEIRPATATLAAQVQVLQDHVVAADLVATYQDYKKGLAQLRQYLAAARQLDYTPLVVQTLLAIGHAEQTATEFKAAVEADLEVRDLAEATHQDLVRARAYVGLCFEYASLMQFDKAHDAARVGRSILRSVSDTTARQPRIGLDQGEAVAYWNGGNRPAALELLLKVDRELRALHGDRFQLAANEVTLGGLFGELGRYDEAIAYLERALRRYVEMQGDAHPNVASIMNNLGTTAYFQGDYAHAADRFREAIAVRDRAGIPADNLGRAYNWLNLGESLVHLGKIDEALVAIAKARPVIAAKLGEATTNFAELLTWEALAQLANKQPATAVPLLERAVETYRKQNSSDPADLAEVELGLARALWDAQPAAHGRAIQLATSAREHFTAAKKDARRTEADGWLANHR